ncbi:hypothetical protein HK096_005202, partial [Nowakowskiella sp. JEL0078]
MSKSEINPKAVEAAQYAANIVDPYFPKLAKDAATYAVNTVEPFVPNIAKSAATYAINTATTVVEATAQTAVATQKRVNETVSATRDFAANKVTQTYEFGTAAVSGATTTITAYTPSPIVNLITSTLESAKAIREDPVGTMKPYIPTFVINAGEKTYEIVSHTVESTNDQLQKTKGFIVTKVNGTIHAINDIPQ